MFSRFLPVWTCSHSVSVNQHEPLMNIPSNPGTRSHVICRTSYGSHSHLLQGLRAYFNMMPLDVSCCAHRATPRLTEPTAYLKVIQANADISAHLEKSRSTWLVQQNVDRDFAECACLLKILKDIQVCQGVCNYGNHLQWKITKVI